MELREHVAIVRDKYRKSGLVCTCGSKVQKKTRWNNNSGICRKCGTVAIELTWKQSRDGFKHHVIDKITMTDKKFVIRKKIYQITPVHGDKRDWEGMDIEFVGDYTTYFDAVTGDVKIFKDNKKQGMTALTRALSHVRPSNAIMGHTFFGAVAAYLGTESLTKVVQAIRANKTLDVFYSTYGSLHHMGRVQDYDRSGCAPHEAMRVPKEVWNMYLKLDSEQRHYFRNAITGVRKLCGKYTANVVCQMVEHLISRRCLSYFVSQFAELVVDYGYSNWRRITEYIFRDIQLYQGILNPRDGATLLIDYLRMCQDMKVKPRKYPKSLKLFHDLTVMNYEVVIDDETIEKFQAIVSEDEYKDLEFSGRDYLIMAPKHPEDVVREGRELCHCVSSYVSLINDRDTKIYFLRSQFSPMTPLITLEVREGMLCQYEGRSHRGMSKKEAEFVNQWVRKMKLDRR